ncbi:DUF2125 domain-containing protein [Pseudogemmobacter bohemicus]|uniref:DUF2125 domain-containing protein n=1 Tax=Pseudogemmobacter bohemicus TaxID=2250708 RepID=UPI000DD2DC8E|nr:DUF2125 domain-containing protein [Pseudogemmobacter bohemicus]
MRWLIGIVAVFLTLWCGWWFAGRYVILSQTDQLIADQRASGAILDLPGFGLSGFPSRFDLSTESIAYSDASGQIRYQGGAAYVYSMSWKPWHLVFWLPDNQLITLGDQVLQLDGKKLHASLRAAPALDLPLALAAFSVETLTLTDASGRSLGFGPSSLRIEAADAPNSYQFGATLTGIRPDPAILVALAATEVPQMPETPLPDQIERFHLNTLITLTAPLDRYAGVQKPRIVSLEIADMSLSWGDLQFVTSGSIAPDSEGFAAGTVTLTVQGWEQLPRLLVATQVIPPNMAGVFASMLRGMASESGDPTRVTMDLVLKDGLMNFGPLPLGPAPKLGLLPQPQG